jgi:hypothetical protein
MIKKYMTILTLLFFTGIIFGILFFSIFYFWNIKQENREIKDELKDIKSRENFVDSMDVDNIEILTSLYYIVDNMKQNGYHIDQEIYLNKINIVPFTDDQILNITNEFSRYFSKKYRSFSDKISSELICNIVIIFAKIDSNEKLPEYKIKNGNISQCSLTPEKKQIFSEMYLLTISINIYDKKTKETKYDDFLTTVISRSYLNNKIKTL